MKAIRLQRVIAALLAASGAWYALLTWMLPPFWPGYIVWAGWFAVACGQKRWQEKWFWIVSASWNLILFALFASDTKWTRSIADFGYWHPRLHLAVAVLVSAYLIVIVPWNTWPENRRA